MVRQIMVILWPSFLVAIVAEGFFFSFFDPSHLTLLGLADYEVDPMTIYSLGFFCFWVFCALASMLTCYMAQVPNDCKGRTPAARL